MTAEEIKSAAKIVPRVLSWAFGLNWVLLLITNLTFMFCIADPGCILNIPTGIPYIQPFMDVTQSRAGGAICVVNILTDLAFAGFSEQACASRQVWAFARNNGVPFFRHLKRVSKGMKVPVASIWASVAYTCALSLINLGSPLTLNALISLDGTAVITSYIFSISCLLVRRPSALPLPDKSKAFLGRYGSAVNIAALWLLFPALVFANFPLFDHPNAAGL
jgi:choline transport protein